MNENGANKENKSNDYLDLPVAIELDAPDEVIEPILLHKEDLADNESNIFALTDNLQAEDYGQNNITEEEFVDEILTEEDADENNDYDIDKEDDYDENYDTNYYDYDDFVAVEKDNPTENGTENKLLTESVGKTLKSSNEELYVKSSKQRRRSFNITGICRLQLVETVPVALYTKNFAQKMPIEHVKTIKVSTLY